jgi:hypothetical protein
MSRQAFLILLSMAAVLAGLTGPASAAYEGFDYAAGGVTGNGGSGWAGNWTGTLPIVSPGFVHPPLATVRNRLAQTVETTGLYRNLGITYDSGTVWISWIARCNTDTSDYRYATLGLTSVGAAKQHFGDLRIGKNHGRPHEWGLRDENNTNNTVETGVSVTSEALLVLRIDFNTNSDKETAYLWINPSLDSEPSTSAADATLSNITHFSFNRIALRRTAPLELHLDEIRVGDTWAAVTPRPLAADFSITAPQAHSVKQRNASQQATLDVEGDLGSLSADAVEVRAVPMAGFSGEATEWTPLTLQQSLFSGPLTVSTGWYRIEARALSATTVVGESVSPSVGVGDVFINCGQSNSCNSGRGATSPSDPRVCAWGPAEGWRVADDPQPFGDGTEGSPWPSFADAYAARHEVPVGLITTGVGATSVYDWLPGGSLYPRLQTALNYVGPYGCKAVLWHQGETDAVQNTTQAQYVQRLESIIAQSRVDIGFDVPWGVAIAAYGPNTAPARIAIINAAQLDVIANDPLVFQGAVTDDLLEGYRIDGGVHFLLPGLIEHGQRWENAVSVFFFSPPGDYNNDGTVDLADYTVWADHYGQSGPAVPGDGNGDGVVDLADYTIWADHFGESVGG